MDCAYHPGTSAVATCSSCRLGICPRCNERKPLADLGPFFNAALSLAAVPLAARPYCRPDCAPFVAERRTVQKIAKLCTWLVLALAAALVLGLVALVALSR
jgi:hypothetical protein